MGEGGDGIGDVWCGRRSRFVRRERPRRRGFVVDEEEEEEEEDAVVVVVGVGVVLKIWGG